MRIDVEDWGLVAGQNAHFILHHCICNLDHSVVCFTLLCIAAIGKKQQQQHENLKTHYNPKYLVT